MTYNYMLCDFKLDHINVLLSIEMSRYPYFDTMGSIYPYFDTMGSRYPYFDTMESGYLYFDTMGSFMLKMLTKCFLFIKSSFFIYNQNKKLI
jgi:hypothetical protein